MEQTAKSAAVKAPPRVHYGWILVVVVVVAVFGSLGLGRFGYSIILPTMQDSLKLTNTQAGELQTWNLVGYLIAAVGAGILAARFSPRIVISFCAVIVAVSMFLTGMAPGFELARWGRALTGLGSGGVNVPAMGLIPSWFGAKRRGLGAGIGVSGSSFGLMLTGPLIPAIIGIYGPDQGWRVSWYVLGGLGLVAAIIAFVFLRNRPAEMGLQPLGEPAGTAPAAATPSVQKASSLDWGLVYKSPALWLLALIYFCFGLSYTIYYTFFARYLEKEGGFTKADAGGLWFEVGVGTVVSGFIWGIASDRWGRRAALLAVFSIQAVSYFMFGLIKNAPGFYTSAFLFSVTAWSIPAIMATICGDRFGARLAPAALGLVTVVFGIGQAIGPVLAGSIADSTQSFSLAFVVAGFVALFGVLGSFFVQPHKTATG